MSVNELIEGRKKRLAPRIPAGRQLDQYIENCVMKAEPPAPGLPIRKVQGAFPSEAEVNEMTPRYSQHIAPAWKVLEKLTQLGFTNWQVGWYGDHFRACLPEKQAGFGDQVSQRELEVISDSAPLAICTLAMRALKIEPQSV